MGSSTRIRLSVIFDKYLSLLYGKFNTQNKLSNDLFYTVVVVMTCNDTNCYKLYWTKDPWKALSSFSVRFHGLLACSLYFPNITGANGTKLGKNISLMVLSFFCEFKLVWKVNIS